jgi:hypothetical protein
MDSSVHNFSNTTSVSGFWFLVRGRKFLLTILVWQIAEADFPTGFNQKRETRNEKLKRDTSFIF